MRAITVREPGGPDVLTLTELPDPVAGPGEVLVDVAAAGVNRADLSQREGHYPPPPGAPEHPGLEVSGWISALGSGVSGWSRGEPVCALLSGGGYAEKVAVPVGQLLPVPAGIGVVDAAALPEVTCTVWSNVFLLAGLRPGETLLVHGGSSGIGTMAVQLARQVGARVAVTAGSAAKLAACAELGAEVLVNYREVDFVEVVRAATGGHGADVVLDVVGAKYLQRNLDVLATGGRLVVIGMQGGRTAELDLGVLLAKRASVQATGLRSRTPEDKAGIVASVRDHVWPLLADGVVRPVIAERMPLAEAARAHTVLSESQHVGKVLLTTDVPAPGAA
ncbi:zinc-binding dehydrogenase [Kineococcus sp. R8]|uniref:zinc-binding dehydrogenase n=1 Tax=Kineococcus siccus TaxID=2696567 RepID=UPI001412E7B0|nr:zinc-binding dehydrogenase [Kineococcus siccus]